MVLTLWLSITAALGDASRPTRSRSAITRRWLMVSNTPVSRHSEPAKDRALGRQIGGQKPPRNPAAQHVKDGVHDLATGPCRGSALAQRLGQTRLDQRPLGIGEIGFVAQALAAIVPSSGRGPHRGS